MYGITRTLARGGIPLAGAVSFAGMHRIEWFLSNQSRVETEGATVNLDTTKLERTMAVLGVIYVGAELWVLNKLLSNPASAKILQEAAEKGAAGTLSQEGAESAARSAGVKAGISRTVGRVLLVDTVIWSISGAVDLGLNLTDLTEEEQIELFEWMGPFNPVKPLGGLSPLSEFVIDPILDFVPEGVWDSIADGAMKLAEWTGLDEYLWDTAEDFVESIDIEFSWWIVGRLISASLAEGAALWVLFNPNELAEFLTGAIIFKVLYEEIVRPFWVALAGTVFKTGVELSE